MRAPLCPLSYAGPVCVCSGGWPERHGSPSWIRTTIATFKVRHPAVRRRGTAECQLSQVADVSASDRSTMPRTRCAPSPRGGEGADRLCRTVEWRCLRDLNPRCPLEGRGSWAARRRQRDALIPDAINVTCHARAWPIKKESFQNDGLPGHQGGYTRLRRAMPGNDNGESTAVGMNLERAAGIEPASSGWKPVALPLNYAR